MTGPATLPQVYLDTNVFIAAFETAGATADHAWWLLHAVEAGEFRAVTSELTLSELLSGLPSASDAGLAKVYDAILTDGPGIHAAPVSRDVLVAAAGLRAGRSGLRLPDAVHCATALRCGCRAMVSDDRRIPRDIGVPIVRFGPATLTELRILTA